MNSTRPPTRRRAFATTFALFLVVLVAGAMLAVGNLMLADARRATRESIDAQLRQLLDVGAVEALRHAGDERVLDSRVIKTALPEELIRQGGSVRVVISPGFDGRGVELSIDAAVAGTRASQKLRASPDGGSVDVDSATLR
jgi:hypothetical protein